MEPTLTPHLALAYLRELSTDVRGGAVFDRGGARLAGEAAIEAGARALLGVGAARGWIQVRASAGWVFSASCSDGAVVLATGPHALPGLVRHDLGAVVNMLFSGHRGAAWGQDPDTVDPAGPEDAALRAPGEAMTALAEEIHAALREHAPRPNVDR